MHAPAQSEYLALTDAMVDIRATLAKAMTENILDPDIAKIICHTAKQLIYRERTLNKAIELLQQNHAHHNTLNNTQFAALQTFQQWLAKNNYVPQKRLDAITLLQTIARKKIFQPKLIQSEQHAQSSPAIQPAQRKQVPRSVFFRSLHKNMMCRPFSSFQTFLPIQEKVALAARYLGVHYRLLRRVAYLLAASHALAMQQNIETTPEQELPAFNDPAFGLENKTTCPIWQQENDCVLPEQAQFAKRMARIHLLLQLEQQKMEADAITTDTTIQDYSLSFMRLLNDYQKYKALAQSELNNKLDNEFDHKNYLTTQICGLYQAQEPEKFQTIQLMATLWWLIERHALRIPLQPTPQELQQYSDKFRYRQSMITQKATEEWLKNNDLDLYGYQKLITSAARFSFLILQNNLESLNIAPEHHDEEAWWFCDALWLTGNYQTAKQLLFDAEKIKTLQQEQASQHTNLEQHAYSLDFVGGEMDFMSAQIPQL